MVIQYKPEFFEIVNFLAPIKESIIFDVDLENKRTLISHNNDNKTIAYILSVPHEYFMIDKSIGFYNYLEFYRFFRLFNNATVDGKPVDPTIEIEGNQIIVSTENSKFCYILNDPVNMKTGPKSITFNSVDFEFKFTNKSLMELNRMKSMIKHSKHASFSCMGDNVKISVFMEAIDNRYEKTLSASNISNNYNETPLDFKIFSNVFEKLPNKFDYDVSIMKPGRIQFKLIHDDIDLKLYTGRVKK